MTLSRKIIGKILIIMAGSGIILLGIDRLGWLNWARLLGERVVVIPVRQFNHDRLLTGQLGQIGEMAANSKLTEMQITINSLTEENHKLSQMLGLSLPPEWQYIKQKVIDAGGDKLILAGGNRGGAVLQMPVILAEESLVYVGKVNRVTAGQTEVVLPSMYGNRLGVVIMSPDKANNSIVGRGLAVGLGAGRVDIEQILNQEVVERDDLVGYQYRDKIVLVGKISEVKSDSDGMFKKASIELAINPIGLITVFIIK